MLYVACLGSDDYKPTNERTHAKISVELRKPGLIIPDQSRSPPKQ